MQFSNPYTNLLKASFNKDLTSNSNSSNTKYIQNLSIQLGLIHNTLGAALKEILTLISRQTTQTSLQLVEESLPIENKAQIETEEPINDQDLMQSEEVLNKAFVLQEEHKGPEEQEMTVEGLQNEFVGREFQISMSEEHSQRKQIESSSATEKMNCFICRNVVDKDASGMCRQCASKQPIIYELE